MIETVEGKMLRCTAGVLYSTAEGLLSCTGDALLRGCRSRPQSECCGADRADCDLNSSNSLQLFQKKCSVSQAEREGE